MEPKNMFSKSKRTVKYIHKSKGYKESIRVMITTKERAEVIKIEQA